MKLQTERCLSCGRLTRPTNLQSKYAYSNDLDNTGAVSYTDYWFCSDKCYEEELKKKLDREYWPEYNEKNLPPGLKAQVAAIWDKFHNVFDPIPSEMWEGGRMDKYIAPYCDREWNLIKKWEIEQMSAMLEVKSDLRSRLEEEYDYRKNKEYDEMEKSFPTVAELEERFAKDQAELEKHWMKQEEKEKREQERLEEKRQREEERRKREEERLKEKQEREDEKRKREEEARAAKEAEEAKWRPRPFKL